MTPLVSVVIPCYNQGHFVGHAIASVGNSTEKNVEIVVVNDGSHDDTLHVAASFPNTRCVTQPNSGLAAARNRGLQESRGRYVVFLDADDMLAPAGIDTGTAALAAHPEAALVFGRCTMMGPDGRLQDTPPQPRIDAHHYRELLRTNYIWMPAAVMFRRKVIERAGGFDQSVNATADYGIYLRIARSYPIFDHGKVVAYYRRHGSNMSGNAGRMLQETLTVLRRERPFVEHDRDLLGAYYDGWQRWQDFYGTELVDEIRAHVRAREWSQAARKSATLAWLHPGGLRHHAVRKLSLTLRGTRHA